MPAVTPPKGVPNASHAREGYHYAEGSDGSMVALSCEDPYAGSVTLFIQTKKFHAKGANAEIVMPADLWRRICESFIREQQAERVRRATDRAIAKADPRALEGI